MSLTIEECYVKKIESGIRSIKLGMKTPEQVKINGTLEKLRLVNDGLFDELQTKYTNIVIDFNRKMENKRDYAW